MGRCWSSRRRRSHGRKRRDQLIVRRVDVAAGVDVCHREDEQKAQEEQTRHQDQRVERLVVAQVHKEHRDQGGLDRRDQDGDGRVGSTEVEVGRAHRDHGHEDEGAEDGQVQPERVDVVIRARMLSRVLTRRHVCNPMR